jgi:hypothetical protein
VIKKHTGNTMPEELSRDDWVRYQLKGDPTVRHAFASSLNGGPGFGDEDEEMGRISSYEVMPSPRGLPRAPAPAAVGDLSSNAVGSAARFNASKPALDLIPAGVIAAYEATMISRPARAPWGDPNWGEALKFLGVFQMRQGVDCAAPLMSALFALDHDRKLWADCARVFDYGREKYAAWNWAKGQAWSVPLGSAMRHIVFGGMRGEDLDPESGLPHRGHVACNIVMLLWFLNHYPEGDDRYTPPVRSA